MLLTLSFLASTLLALHGPHCLTLATARHEAAASVGDTGGMLVQQTLAQTPHLLKPSSKGFHGASVVHVINLYYEFLYFNTLQGAAFWTNERPVFRAWRTQQPFTLPLFQLGNAFNNEYIYLIGPDAETAPIVSGFNDVAVIAWVYDTPVCGSVPLLSAVYASATDHFYSIDTDEHEALLTLPGWADTGVVAYVLPLTSS